MKKRFFLFLIFFSMTTSSFSACRQIVPLLDFSTLTPLPAYTSLPTLTLLPTYTKRPSEIAAVAPTSTPKRKMSPTPPRVNTLQPTYTPWATLTRQSMPTEDAAPVVVAWSTVTPYINPTALPPTELDTEFPCGDKMQIAVTFSRPELVKTITGHLPIGTFLFMRVRIKSLDGINYGALLDPSFKIHAMLYGRDVTFLLDRYNSDYTNSRWGVGYQDWPISPTEIQYYITFDVNDQSKNFILEFSPVPVGQTEPICSVSFPIPKIK